MLGALVVTRDGRKVKIQKEKVNRREDYNVFLVLSEAVIVLVIEN